MRPTQVIFFFFLRPLPLPTTSVTGYTPVIYSTPDHRICDFPSLAGNLTNRSSNKLFKNFSFSSHFLYICFFFLKTSLGNNFFFSIFQNYNIKIIFIKRICRLQGYTLYIIQYTIQSCTFFIYVMLSNQILRI